MSTPAPLPTSSNPTNARGGPITEAGKAASSQNAITHGLFAAHDLIRPGEQPLYSEFAETLRADLAPDGLLEISLADEIRRAIWRLRRCGQIEEGLAQPEQEASAAALQLSVDRARSQSHRLLHKCTAELRKLQNERQYRNEFFEPGTDITHLGVCDFHLVQKNINQQVAADYRSQTINDKAEIEALLAAPMPRRPTQVPESSFCKNAPEPKSSFCKNEQQSKENSSTHSQTPRNAPCPCGSGIKHKRCCGKEAPPVLHAA